MPEITFFIMIEKGGNRTVRSKHRAKARLASVDECEEYEHSALLRARSFQQKTTRNSISINNMQSNCGILLV